MTKAPAVFQNIFLTVFCVFFWSCVTADSNVPPQWVADISVVYPSDKYITGHGYGKTKQDAEMNGLSAISRYFEQNISVNTASRTTVASTGQSNNTINDELFIKSQTELFAVQYSQPYFNEPSKEWETVAYIARNEAWKIFEPRLKEKTDILDSLYSDAESEPDFFRKAMLFSRAHKYAGENNIGQILDFAATLHPDFSPAYSFIREEIADMPAKTARAKGNAVTYIECENDFGNSIHSGLSKALEGFSITTDKNEAAYVCRAVLTENVSELPAGIFYKPVVAIDITGKNGGVYSLTTELDRVGASDRDIAKRRMYLAVANVLQERFLKD
jgi:hypothetical protein